MMRRRRPQLIAGVAGALLLATAFAGAAVKFTPSGCHLVGGRWGSVQGTCTTQACYYLGECGDWTHPLGPCHSIPLGTSVARVHFLLGDPSRRDADASYWENYKSSSRIRAEFKHDQLVELTCLPL